MQTKHKMKSVMGKILVLYLDLLAWIYEN